MSSSFQPDLAFRGVEPPEWLRAFAARPVAAFEDLLLGRAAFGHLNAEEPVEVLVDWLEALDPEAGLAGALDEACARWIGRSWGTPVLKASTGSSAVTARAWCRVADLVASEPRLNRAAKELRELFLNDSRFLRALSEGRARDPEGRCWLALARHQDDRELLDEWWRLCGLPPDVPWHHGSYGILGLRGLAAEHEHLEGTFPTEVAEGLARLAVALAGREREGWLSKKAAQEEFSRTARMTMAAYPWPERWLSFWRHSLAAHRIRLEMAQKWVRSLFPRKLEAEATRRVQGRSPYLTLPDPGWRKQAEGIARELAAASPEAIERAKELLEVEESFARQTGDSFPVVRSATTFASRIRKQRPELALEWAQLARDYEPWDAFAWTTSSAALTALGRPREAIHVGLGAVERFPQDVVARTGLGEALKAANRPAEAVDVFRDTVERFPDNVVARTGLGEALKAANRPAEAVEVFRDTVERFPQDVVARNGLGEALKAANRPAEGVEVFRDTVERFPQDVVARNGLGEALKAANQPAEAVEVFRDTVERFPDNVVARTGLGEALKAANQPAEAVEVFRDTVERFPQDEVAVDALDRALDAVGDAGRSKPAATVEPVTASESRDRYRTADVVAEPADVYDAEHAKGARHETEETAFDAAEAPAAEYRQLRRRDVEILIQDVYMLRRWSRAVPGAGDNGVMDPGALRERASRLLEQLARLQDVSAEAAGELGLLEMDSGDLDDAIELLRAAAKRFPGSARVRYALARAERELTVSRNRPFDRERADELSRPWRRLVKLDNRYRPVQLLGEGRAWLVQVDGTFVERQARKAFGQLGFWMHGATSARRNDNNEDPFPSWWAGEVQRALFGDLKITREKDLTSLVPIRDHALRRQRDLDMLEETWVRRVGRV